METVCIIAGNTPFQPRLLEFNHQYKHTVGLTSKNHQLCNYIWEDRYALERAVLKMMQYISVGIGGNETIFHNEAACNLVEVLFIAVHAYNMLNLPKHFVIK